MSMEGVIFGCWDLFHVGHLNALKQCGECVDILYVGVFSDKAILDYKGRLPVIPQKQRMEILYHIRLDGCKILPFIVEKRAAKNWAIRYMFVSETLRGKKLHMVEKEKYRGTILYIRYTPDISTSSILHKIWGMPVFGD